MNIIIRQEIVNDHPFVFQLIEKAFQKEQYSDKREQFLVERLRNSDAFIPELSLVAIYDEQIVGHILLTKIKIVDDDKQFDSLALAPVSVLPEFQGKGIGGKLIQKAHEVAQQLGHRSIILLGHEKYYPRFGYQPVHTFSIKLPFDAPKENCMALELTKGSLKTATGIVVYPKEFSE